MADPKDKPAETKPEPKTPPSTPKPASLDVNTQGSNGKYNLIIQVISDQGFGMSADILIVLGEQTPIEKTTEKNGLLIYPVAPFTEEELEIMVQVVGATGLEQEVTLDGPEKKTPKRKRTGPVPGGFWANVRNTIKQNKTRK